jgi:hypothetical protein
VIVSSLLTGRQIRKERIRRGIGRWWGLMTANPGRPLRRRTVTAVLLVGHLIRKILLLSMKRRSLKDGTARRKRIEETIAHEKASCDADLHANAEFQKALNCTRRFRSEKAETDWNFRWNATKATSGAQGTPGAPPS